MTRGHSRQKVQDVKNQKAALERRGWRGKQAPDITTSGRDFPGGAVVKNLPANAGDVGSSPGPGRSHMLRSN